MIKIFNEHIWKKAKIKLMPILLSTAIIFTGCHKKPEVEVDNNKTISSTYIEEDEEIEILEMYDEYEENTTSTTNYEQETSKTDTSNVDKILSTNVTISKEEVELYQQKVNEVVVNYQDSDLFHVPEALQEYSKIIVSKDLGTTFQIDEDKLYNQVLDNNQKYLSEHPFNSYNETSDSDIRKIVSIITANINNKLATNTFIDYNQLSKTLKELKVFTYSGFGAGAIDDIDTVLSIDMATVDNYQKTYPDTNILEMIVKHESNHLIQVTAGSSLEGKNYKKNYGICYQFSNLAVNPLDNQWLLEAACEKQVLNDYNDGTEPLFYQNQILGLESITLSIILNSNNNSTSIEDNMFQHDLDKFMNIFNAKTNEQKQEIINMIYSFELYYDEKDDFNQQYENKYGYSISSELEDYTTSLRGSIALTLSKLFYNNLSEIIAGKSVTLKDIYTLISVFENDISRLTWYNSKYENYNEFLTEYNLIQNNFFGMISENTNLDIDTLQQKYNEYHRIKETDVQIDWLNSDQNRFLNHIAETREKDRKPSINEVYQRLENKNIYTN